MANTPKQKTGQNNEPQDHRPRDWYNHICVTCGTHDCKQMRAYIDGTPTQTAEPQDADN